MAFAAFDSLREDYEVYPVVDAIGGTSVDRLGLARVRAAARLEPPRDGVADRRDRVDERLLKE
jgi:hypothetical protein